jgi:hypothetical protein
LGKDPIAGLDAICRNFGTDLRAVAAHVLGQPAPERDAVIDGLKAELAQVKQQIGGVTKTFEEQRASQVSESVTQFFTANPRADELSRADLDVNIPDLIQRGFTLEKAYRIAEAANPAAQPHTPQAVPQPQPLASKSRLSVQGAPSGSNPETPRAKSTGEAIDRALAKFGIA